MNMQTNFMNIFLGNPGMGNLPVADLSLNHPDFFPVENSTEQFQNLLDLVSDIDLADGQSPEFPETLDESLNGISDSLLQDMKVSQNQSEISILQHQFASSGLNKQLPLAQAPNIGQRVEKPDEMNELVSNLTSMSVPLNEMERTAIDLNRQELNRQTDKPKGEAVQMWAAGIATGDITSVDVMAPVAKQIPQTDPKSFEFVLGFKNPGASPQNEGLQKEPLESQRVLKDPPKVESTTQVSKAIEVKPVFKIQTESPAEPVTTSTSTKNVGSNEKPQTVQLESFVPANPVKVETSVNQISKTEPNKELKTWESSEFLLKEQTKTAKKIEPNSAVSDLAPAAAFVAKESVLGGQGKLATVDNRLSSHSVGFVAEKVQNLVDQGGGQIRVQLNPHNLGSLEIRVSMKPGGGVDVQVRAEKETTRIAFENSKGDLTQKLQQLSGQSHLEVTNLGSTKTAFEATKVLPQNEHVMSSRDLGSLMDFRKDVTNDAVKPETSLRALEKSAPTSSEFLGDRGSQGQTKEDSRSRAMNQWEEQFKDRKSA